jgi:hypothetical protein
VSPEELVKRWELGVEQARNLADTVAELANAVNGPDRRLYNRLDYAHEGACNALAILGSELPRLRSMSPDERRALGRGDA